MQFILLLALFGQDAPDTFGAKPKVNVELVKSQLQATRDELKAANDQIDSLKRELEQSRAVAASQPVNFDITGFEKLQFAKTEMPNVQWVVTTSPTCQYCHIFVNSLRTRLGNRWRIGDTSNAHFRISNISTEEWQRSGWLLPRIELFVNGESKYVGTSDSMSIDAMANSLNDEANNFRAKGSDENLVGLRLGTLGIKPQVVNLIHALEPFLDGGTLTCTYTPRAGVVKEYLTIQQGSVGLRIPAKTSFTLTCNSGKAAIKFAQPTVQVRIPVRGNTDVKSMTLTPSEFAIQLPWMIDPEWTITNP